MCGKLLQKGRYVRRPFHESHPRLPSDQTGTSPLAGLQSDENPNADYLERTGSENLGARLWRLPPKSANTLHKHIRAEEFYFVLEGVGRMRVGDETLTVPKYGGVLVGPDQFARCSMIQTPKCFGLSWARRRNLNFCPVRRPSPTYPSFIRLTRNSCRKNWPAWNGRPRVDRPKRRTAYAEVGMQ